MAKKALDEMLLRLPEVEKLCGFKKTTIYGMIKKSKFPAPIKLSPRLSVWPKSIVNNWMCEAGTSA